MRICSKFSVKCEASHKNIVIGTYRKVLHLTITVCRKLQDKVYIRINIITYCQFFFYSAESDIGYKSSKRGIE